MIKFLTVILLAALFMFLNYCNYTQPDDEADSSYELIKLYNLPDELDESSGIILYDSLVWTINDSGRDALIYAIQPVTGKIVKTVEIINGVNNDWEDIAQNENYMLIGDFGNNEGSRKDLRIYCIPKASLNEKQVQKVTAGIINYTYENQQDFTPALYANPFDCEAMVATTDSIYLFTKDWLNLITVVYSLPITEGTVTARKIGNFNSDGLVTGADMSPEDQCVVLCGYNLFYPFIIVIDNVFNLSSLHVIGLEELSGVQIEGVAIAGKGKYLFSNEKSAIPQSLHKIRLKKQEKTISK